uniref:Uncharacterized protein n=1 Tax=Bombyx mori TaxID=7091 RepID=A0A8R2HQ12_BOMMO|nr:uncharacterized protein LOC110386880 [Bombyx mori]
MENALALVYFHLVLISCQDLFGSDNVIIGNLKRRDTVPLNQFNRRNYKNNNLNYRRTKDIQDDVLEKKLELAESQLREAKLDKEKLEKLHNELRWLTVDNEQGIGIGIK